MSIIPLKNKLAYAWERTTHKDRLYSRVFEQRINAGVIGHADTYINKKHFFWLKATKIEGPGDFYKVDLTRRGIFARPDWKNMKTQRS